MKNRTSKVFYAGLFCILFGLIFNQFVIGRLLTSDGNIQSLSIQVFIIACQLTMVSIGFCLIKYQPVIPGTILRHWVLNLTLTLISLTTCLIVAELFVRALFPFSSENDTQFNLPHPVLGWVRKPGSNHIHQRFAANSQVTYNSQGWRDVEHQVKKPKGTFRILVIGDSFMEAKEVQLEQSFARQLDYQAKAAGYDVEVISMGVGGYGTLQEYLVFEEFGKQYAPDLVLLAFFMNDLGNNSSELSSSRARPQLDPNHPDQWKIIPVDYQRLKRKILTSDTRHQLKNSDWIHKLALVKLVNNVIQTRQRIKNSLSSTNWIAASQCTELPVYTRAWHTTERILTRFKTVVEAAGSQLVVFTVPAIVEVAPDDMQKALSYTEQPEKYCLEEAPSNRRLGQILKPLGVDLIDLLPDFRKANREQGISLYPIDDGHWNASGHALAAKRVLSELESSQHMAIQKSP